MKKFETAPAAEPAPTTPQERINNGLREAQHALTVIMTEELPPALERDIVAAVAKIIAIRYKLEAPPRPAINTCPFNR